jgi:hypothetical protein
MVIAKAIDGMVIARPIGSIDGMRIADAIVASQICRSSMATYSSPRERGSVAYSIVIVIRKSKVIAQVVVT